MVSPCLWQGRGTRILGEDNRTYSHQPTLSRQVSSYLSVPLLCSPSCLPMREDEDRLSPHPFSLNSDPGVNNAYLGLERWRSS